LDHRKEIFLSNYAIGLMNVDPFLFEVN
jgi:hypothetical protein